MQDERHDELHTIPSLVVIVSGPGGVGKGTIVEALVARDQRLLLSRSWTTRLRRDGERQDAYHFVTRDEFEGRIADSGFLEWTSFLGNYYGTPLPEAIDGRDLVLEIEVDGARQVKLLHPDAVLVFVLPPSRLEQQRRLRGRGDAEDKVEARLRKAEEEEPVGIAMADHVVVNDDLELTLQELARIVSHERKKRAN
ncbi:MAG: guanylate kinase [Actinomycetota bacterium]|jgi:guanylate kinase